MELKIDNLTPEQIDIIKTQVAEYEKENENQKPKDVIDYEDGWIIVNDKAKQAVDFLNETIRKSYSIGLYRDTKEEAEKLLRKMKIEHRLRQWAKMCKENVDWNNSDQEKYFCYVTTCNGLEINSVCRLIENSVYFTDRSILRRAIEDIGEQNLIDNYFVEA